jgi:hypothetical protein
MLLGNLMEFISYHKYPFAHIETISTADGTTQPKGLEQ